MKREILFRGKRVDTGGWVKSMAVSMGAAINRKRDCVYLNVDDVWRQVVTETVTQFTGILDKNEVKVFEGDIVSCTWNELNHRGYLQSSDSSETYSKTVSVEFVNGAFVFMRSDGRRFNNRSLMKIEVIGNIFDNKDLLV